MADIKAWWRGHRPSTRRLVQLYAALLYNANLRGFVEGEIFTGASKALCAPGLNCYSCPGAVASCPLGALQNALAASGHRAGWYALGILLLFGLTLGRTICGWLCPMGFVQELLYKLPTRKLRKSRVTRALSWVKYGVLAVFVIAIPLGYGLSRGAALPAFCKYICPAGTLEGAAALLAHPGNGGMFAMLGLTFTRKFVILMAVLLACALCYRAFCRFLCPLGALYGLFNRVALTGVRVDAGRCNGCGACLRACPMDVRSVGDRECIHCAKCAACCAQGAISLRCGSAVLAGPGPDDRPPKRRRRLAWAAALAALAAVLVWANFIYPAVKAKPARAEAAEQAESVPEAAPGTEEAEQIEPGPGEEPGTESGEQAEPEPEEVPEMGEGEQAESGPGETPGAGAQGTEAGASGAPLGAEVGNRLPDFSAELMDGRTFRLGDCLGRPVFINLWATYCGPCVEELPLFERLKAEHPQAVVLAVHSALVTEDVAGYLADKGWTLDFAVDTPDEAIFRAVNGSAMLPQTIVLDARGEVVYNRAGAVTYALLESLL